MTMPRRRAVFALLGFLGSILVPLGRAPAAAEPALDFARDIRPILADRCFTCHGPDAATRKGDLRLDRAEDAFADHDGVAAFVAGKPGQSEALRRMTADERTRMPPARSGKTLSEREIALIRQWIEQGARWGDHWAFAPPVRPAVPITRQQPRPSNPIDAFVRARLEAAGLTLSPEADRVTLLRRLSLDLIGLPPTIAEIDAFLADNQPDSYARQVERLLHSPHYGERWGRHWLDAARYADSDGYEKDKRRWVWAYRDWVIAALNQDLPYNRFVIEQIAGDLLRKDDGGRMKDESNQAVSSFILHPSSFDSAVATGFLRNSMINEEGGIDPEQFRMEAMFDRMDAVGKSILGLTIQCAQCHNHKYDPLTQEEYYRMFAFLNDCHEANIAVYTEAEERRRRELFRQMRDIEAELQRRHPSWAQEMAAWEEAARRQPQWTVLRPTVDGHTAGGQKYLPQSDGSFLAQGYAPTKHRVKLTARTPLQGITAFRLELLNDPELPLGGPGRSIKGTSALTEFEVEAAPADDPGKVTRVKLIRATADFNMPETPLDPIFDDKSGKRRVLGPIDHAIDGKDETAWGIDAGPGRRNQPRQAVFTAAEPLAFPQETVLTFYLKQNHGGWNSDDNQNHNLGRFRLAVTSAADPVADPVLAPVRAILAEPAERRTPAQVQTVFGFWRTTVPGWKEANDRIESLWRQHPEGSSQLVLQPRTEPRPTFLLQRGDFLKPGKRVEPGVPAFLHGLAAGPTELPRLAFARWLVDRKAPTTARAFVNRVWQAYFGIGLVGTSEDLGTQGERPSHPELLDWLAVAFMESGWKVKDLHRLMVTSATYRQSSQVTPALREKDRDNRLLARAPRLRVEAEIVRDIALSASGLLDPQLGGPSVFPPAPDFLFLPPASYGPKVWEKASQKYRRSLYTFSYRSVPYPTLQTFDAPNGDFACVRRTRSNTPLQALVTLNEPVFLDCARALALRTLRNAGRDDEERLTNAFRRCVARPPTEAESKVLLAFLNQQAEHFAKPDARPWDLAAADPKNPPVLPAGETPARLAAWTALCRVLLNLDETITKE